ncbi:MAG: sensor histidine kinase [Pedosphaera sp.]|nr:sensor histidine kinase [Pedosphaera sp.]
MKRKLIQTSVRYMAALKAHLRRKPQARSQPARGLGVQAIRNGLETLDLAMIHKHALTTLVLPHYSSETRNGMINRAETFFVEAIKPIEKAHHAAMETNIQLTHLNRALRLRTRELATTNRRLKQEIAQRKLAEYSLNKSERQHRRLLAQSRRMQEQLRYLSHQILWAQEEERKQISRELHDDIAQTLAGINVYLAALQTEPRGNSGSFSRNITRTQRLVERAVDIVHRFARELRPALLDDLGLIPALHSFLDGFTKRTRIRVRFTAFEGVEQLNSNKRTVLYRVAQAALANVAQHARARRVEVSLQKFPGAIRMEIHDDGKSFQVDQVLSVKRNKHLGLLGMRERVEMVGGSFSVESEPGKGTTIRAQIPHGNHNGA